MVRVLKFGHTPKRVINIGTTAQTEESLTNNHANIMPTVQPELTSTQLKLSLVTKDRNKQKGTCNKKMKKKHKRIYTWVDFRSPCFSVLNITYTPEAGWPKLDHRR